MLSEPREASRGSFGIQSPMKPQSVNRPVAEGTVGGAQHRSHDVARTRGARWEPLVKVRALLGSHLYNQIVIPLLVASILVGVVASAVAVYFLRDLTTKWVTEVATATTANVVDQYERSAEQMLRVASIAAESPQLQDAIDSGDPTALHSAAVAGNVALDFDSLAVLDASGTVVASSGQSSLPTGTAPLPEVAAAGVGSLRRPYATFTELNGQPAMTVFRPVQAARGGQYTIALSRLINNRFLERIAGSSGAAYFFFDPDKQLTATALPSEMDSAERTLFRTSLVSNTAVLKDAVDSVKGDATGSVRLRLNGVPYQALAREVRAPDLPDGSPGVLGGYMVGIVSQQVSDQASRTTTNLILIWSVIAVVALVGLGGWVARAVSNPLVELAAGARRIADGDFSTKVNVNGTNEIATLAATFNEMTDSLSERSDSLTKKVLELATLYEMSRALGATLDMDDLLGSVLDSALRIFDLDLGYVTLREKDTRELSIRAARGADEAATAAVRSSMSEWVVREGRPLIFNPDPAAGAGRIDVVTGAKAALCVPMVSAEGTIGSITVGSGDLTYRFNSDDVRLLSTIANHVTIAIGNIELFTSLQEAYLATVRSLAAAVDAKDAYTRGHSDHVAGYATLIAERMGLSHEQRIALEMAAYLHDIGKIGVKEEILLKPGALTSDEMDQMRHHPLIGANILKPITFPWAITPVVRHHHEHYDGTGYPAGLTGEEIPLLARILTAADSYDAMTADRPYRAGRSSNAAIEEMRRCSGTQFDPRVVEALAEIVEELERTGDGLLAEPVDAVAPEEARAIFSALVDGVLSSFRRLGGPRLSSNVEAEIESFLGAEEMPFRVERGRLSFTQDAPAAAGDEIEMMRRVLAHMDKVMGRVSGTSLVEHFYTDALDGFSGRMRHLAGVLEFRDQPR